MKTNVWYKLYLLYLVYWLPWLCWLFSSRLFSNLYCMNLSFPGLTFIAQNKWIEHWFFYKVHNYLQSPFMCLLCWWIVSNQDVITIFTAHAFIVIVNESRLCCTNVIPSLFCHSHGACFVDSRKKINVLFIFIPHHQHILVSSKTVLLFFGRFSF